MFLSSFSSKLLIRVLVSFPSLLVPCRFLFHIMQPPLLPGSFCMLLKYPVSSWNILITSVLNHVSDRLANSSSLSCIFSGALNCSFIWVVLFVSECLLRSKGWSLRCSPGWGNPCGCTVMRYVGEGSEREVSLAPLSARVQSLPQLPTNWAFLVLIPRWVGLCTF